MGICSKIGHVCSTVFYGSLAATSGVAMLASGAVAVSSGALSLPLWVSFISQPRFYDIAAQAFKADAAERLPKLSAITGLGLLVCGCSYRVMKASLRALTHNTPVHNN